MSKEESKMKCHWYSLAFIGLNPIASATGGESYGYSSSYVGCVKQGITRTEIRQARETAGAEQGAVLLSCCYLGEMTEEEFHKDVIVP